MAQGYYTLQEAAQFLDMSPDELKQMTQKKEIRSFQDRGTLRFRIQDVQELGRRRGTTSSEPDLVLRDLPPSPPKSGPKSGGQVSPKSPSHLAPKTPAGPRTPTKAAVPHGDDIFDFSLDIDDKVDIGKEILSGGSKKSGLSGKTPVRSPQPKPGSDSDVRLVGAPGQAGSDSDVKLPGPDSDVILPSATAKTPKVARNPVLGAHSPTPVKSGRVPQPDSAPTKRPSHVTGVGKPADSGVRLVPMDMESDSDVKIVGVGSDEVSLGDSPPQSSTDSDIRLERYAQPAAESGEGELPLTEEINLDEEIRKQEAALQQPQAKVKRKSKLKLSPASPFELAEPDGPSTGAKSGARAQPGPKSGPKAQSPADSSDFDLTPASPADSSDFDLAPAGSDSVLLQPDASDDFSLELPDDSALGGEHSNLSGPSSGISLNNPVDAGISLEEGSPDGSMDFDLSLEVQATPKPAPAGADSDSEFELSLDADDSGPQPAAPSSADSDSEFELTLDDSGGMASLDGGDTPAPQLKADSVEKDIFETDFEVPALDDDSGSQVAPLDTDLDSSDFDIALDDSAVEDESASQVVALDEEADEAAATREDEGAEVEVDGEAGFGGLEVGEEEAEGVAEVEEEVAEARTVVKEMQPAPWGALPVVFMLPCVIVMVLVGLLGFELVQSAGGYKSPGMLTKAISEMIGQKIK